MAEGRANNSDRKNGVAATGSVLGAVLVSSCCIAPLVLITLGVSGAWIGNLTSLKAYQPIFLVITVSFLAYGFWRAYGTPKRDCDSGACATSVSDRALKVVLWVATGVVVLAMTADFWAPVFY